MIHIKQKSKTTLLLLFLCLGCASIRPVHAAPNLSPHEESVKWTLIGGGFFMGVTSVHNRMKYFDKKQKELEGYAHQGCNQKYHNQKCRNRKECNNYQYYKSYTDYRVRYIVLGGVIWGVAGLLCYWVYKKLKS